MYLYIFFKVTPFFWPLTFKDIRMLGRGKKTITNNLSEQIWFFLFICYPLQHLQHTPNTFCLFTPYISISATSSRLRGYNSVIQIIYSWASPDFFFLFFAITSATLQIWTLHQQPGSDQAPNNISLVNSSRFWTPSSPTGRSRSLYGHVS